MELVESYKQPSILRRTNLHQDRPTHHPAQGGLSRFWCFMKSSTYND